MNSSPVSPKRPNYGIDAPNLVLRFLLIGTIGSTFAFAFSSKGTVLPLAQFFVGPYLTFLLMAMVMIWGSKVGKLRLRDKVINSIPWRGDENVLDVGCGRGLMLIAAAKRLGSGNASGIDLWQKVDQSGNSREATLQNVRLENVSNRVALCDGDVRSLPFTDNSFDVVLSSWALHNIYDRAGREGAIREIVRVLKPGGRLAIIDIRHIREYAKVLRESRIRNVRRSDPNFLFVIPTFTLTATK